MYCMLQIIEMYNLFLICFSNYIKFYLLYKLLDNIYMRCVYVLLNIAKTSGM
jgi:hypothetical protein